MMTQFLTAKHDKGNNEEGDDDFLSGGSGKKIIEL